MLLLVTHTSVSHSKGKFKLAKSVQCTLFKIQFLNQFLFSRDKTLQSSQNSVWGHWRWKHVKTSGANKIAA